MKPIRLLAITALMLPMTTRNLSAQTQIVFSVRSWEGDYSSHDIAHGVAQSAHTDAIFFVNADGTGLRQVKTSVTSPYSPACSPDGKWLYFQALTDGLCNLYRCRLDGTGIQNLTVDQKLGKESYGLTVCKDGRILYTVHDGTTGRGAIMDADGQHPRIIAPDIGYYYMAALGPDGQRIVFSHTAEGYTLKTIGLDGTGLLALTPGQAECFCGHYTADGKWIVFFRRDGDVYRVGSDGTGFQRLTTGNGTGAFKLTAKDEHGGSDPPDIAPDGKHIAYTRLVDGIAQVFVMNLDGSDPRQLTKLPGYCGVVKWNPNGQQIAFVSFVGAWPQLLVIEATGGEPKQLTDLKGAVRFLSWKAR